MRQCKQYNSVLSDEERAGQWKRLMRRGDFESAWRISDEVLRKTARETFWHLPRDRQLVWSGGSLDGKRVLVRCYHGLGDTIQFIRYAQLLKKIAAEVIVWAQPSLLSLLQTAAGIDRLLPLHDGAPAVEFDVDVELMELLHVFRSTLLTLPAGIPYLHVPRSELTDEIKFRVGLVWKAGDWDDGRSIPFELLRPLGTIEGVRLIILQKQAPQCGWVQGIGEACGGIDPFADAQIMQTLDLMISVDTMPVHLAGALGVTTWNLVPFEADWRWMENRDDSPWYPTMRLFRQSAAGDWTKVIDRVTEELKQAVAHKQNGD
ncbi:MAG: ADP-heptose--LPS heptosyltransferase [Pyrinomonadaceae bacterium]